MNLMHCHCPWILMVTLKILIADKGTYCKVDSREKFFYSAKQAASARTGKGLCMSISLFGF